MYSIASLVTLTSVWFGFYRRIAPHLHAHSKCSDMRYIFADTPIHIYDRNSKPHETHTVIKLTPS